MKHLKIKTVGLIIVSLAVCLLLGACKKGLDYTNNTTISPDNVWADSLLIKAFLNDIYGANNPGWVLTTGDASDEAITAAKNFNPYLRGTLTPAVYNVNLDYKSIDKANFFLDKLQTVPTYVLSASLNARLTGEAKFWRAWVYWNMVKKVGGVPLILHTQDYTNISSLNVPRSKTSVCIAQIVKDLDSAISLLPGNYSGADYGRITKGAAMAFKGRILLWWASPLFNPANDGARWQAAYDANKAAVDFLTTQGFSLNPNFRSIWYTKGNKEEIMFNIYYSPDHGANFTTVWPGPLASSTAATLNQPHLSLLLAFPKRDGSPMQFDKNLLSTDPNYNKQFLTDFYTNRDDRFYSTIFSGGTPYPTPDFIVGQTTKTSYWTAWKLSGTTYTNMLRTIYPAITNTNVGLTGFYNRKILDTTTSFTGGTIINGKTNWIEIRYAEVLMNLGECANETGRTSEALNALYLIRARAKIAAGTGNYGVTASNQTDIRTAYINERQVEFAFENKRLDDLRRWKRYDIINSQIYRHGLYLTLKSTAINPLPADNIMTSTVRDNFTANYIDNLDGDPTYKFALDLNHWFYSLSDAQIATEPTFLPQNIEWGGTFDPLQ